MVVSKKDDQSLAYFNNQTYTLNNAIKDYLTTASGLKQMATDFTNLLIYYFYQSVPYTINHGNDSLNHWANQFSEQLIAAQNEVGDQISLINSQAQEIKDLLKSAEYQQKQWDQFGGNQQRYQIFNIATKLRSNFIDNLTKKNYLNWNGQENISTNDLADQSQWQKIQFNNDQLLDPIAKVISQFQQFLFDDWYQYTHPVAVMDVQWNYAPADTKGKEGLPILETIYDKKLLSNYGVTLPSTANYQFPAFNAQTQEKFQNFWKNVDNNNNGSSPHQTLIHFTDEKEGYWQVYSLNDLGQKEKLSSQKTAAILQIYNSNLLKNNPISVVNPIKKEDVQKENILANFVTENNDGNGKKIRVQGNKLFQANDHSMPNKNTKHVYDFRQIEGKQKKWILYKDQKGAHALTIEGINNQNSKKKDHHDTNKEILLYFGMLHKNNITFKNQVNYNLFNELKNYLTKNLDAIILRYLINRQSTTPITSSNNTNESNPNIFNANLINQAKSLFYGTYNPFLTWDFAKTTDNKLKNLLLTANNFLSASYFNNKLWQLREKLTKDYTEFLSHEPFEDQGQYYSNLNNGLASRLPDDIVYENNNGQKQPKSVNPKENGGGFENLEKVFFPPATSNQKQASDQPIATPNWEVESLKQCFEEYKKEVTNFFTTPYSTTFQFASPNLKKASKAVHFADEKAINHPQLLINPLTSLLLTSLKINGLSNDKNIAKLIQQKLLNQEVVKNYYDYENNDWKINNNNKLQIANDNLEEEFKNNFFLKYYGNEFINQKVKTFFWKEQKNGQQPKSKAAFVKLLEKIQKQKYFVNSTSGLDLVSEQMIADFQLFLTIDWLLKDNWTNFRDYLMDFIGYNNQAGFVWVNETKSHPLTANSFGKNGYTAQNGEYQSNNNPNNQLFSPFFTNQNFQKVDNFNSDQNNWSFANIQNNQSNDTVGFKGLVKKEDATKLTNETIGKILFDNTYKKNGQAHNNLTGLLSSWESKNDLITYVQKIKTVSQLQDLVENLQTHLPKVDFQNVLRKTIKSPVSGSKEVVLSLAQRINALLNIINGFQIEYRTESEKVFNTTTKIIYDTVCSNTTQKCLDQTYNFDQIKNNDRFLTNSWFQRFSGSLTNGITQSKTPYAIKQNNSSTTYVVYLQQINYGDLVNFTKFEQLLKTVSKDAILQTLFAAAKEEKQQKLALFSYLNSQKGKKIIVYDQGLADALDQEWYGVS